MGAGIVAGIGAVVGAGVSAASSAGLFGGGGTPSFPKVNLQGVSLPSPTSGLAQYGQQAQDIPQVQQTATAADTSSNQAYQAMLSGVDPGLMSSISQIGSLANTYLSGQIPQDVQDQIQRATAQQSEQGGYGDTQMARNLTARDLGLTSLQLQQTGASMAGTGMQMAGAVNPSFTPVSSLLMTPSQLQARTDQAAYYNTDIKNQQAIINSGNTAALQALQQRQSQTQSAGLTSGINSGISALFGKSGSSGGGLIGSLATSGGNSGSGNFDFNTTAGQLGYLGLS
jgi:hypothetical protein